MAKKKSFLVVGLGRFGTKVALQLTALGQEVMAVDICMDNIEPIKDLVTNAAQCDMTNETVVKSLGVSDFDAVIIGMGDNVRAALLTTVLCAEHGAKNIICKAQDELQSKLLLKVGASKIVNPESAAGERLANSLALESIVDYLNLSEHHSIGEIMVPQGWIGKSLIELDVRKKYSVSVFAIRRGGELIVSLNAATAFCKGDIAVMIGENEDLRRVAEL